MAQKRYFSPGTSTTYIEGIHLNIPSDAVEITEETYQEVFSNRPTGKVVVVGADGQPQLADWQEPAPSVPESVTMMQARLAMLNAGILEEVQTAIDGMAGDEGKAARIQWEFAMDVRRDWPLVAALQGALRLSDKQADDLFIAAAAIQ